MGRLVVHIGLPKTGTTSVQRVVGTAASAEGWDVFTDHEHPTLGWDAAQRLPVNGQVTAWDGDGTWRAVMNATKSGTADVFISHENISAASTARVHQLVRDLRTVGRASILVVVTTAPLATLLVRRHSELSRRGVPAALAGFDHWIETFDWRSRDPDPDGSAVRADVIAARWSRAGLRVKVMDSGQDVTIKFARLLGVTIPDVPPRYNTTPGAHVSLTATATRECRNADRAIAHALAWRATADLSGMPLPQAASAA